MKAGQGGKGERILVIEDESGITAVISRAFEASGYKGFMAKSLKEAANIFKKEKGRFDLVLSDVVLPDGTGPELIRELLALKPKLKVIFISGFLDEKAEKEIIETKGYKFLPKPFELTTLLATISEALCRK